MKTSNSKKRFVLSLVVTIVSIAMLVGATFAWFTDSVTSGKNKIVAGNLDIELEYTTDGTTWNPVTESTKLFGDDALWEPGYTEVAYLRLSNKGNLALKYNLSVNVDNEVEGTNVDGETFKLSDHIKMGVVDDWNGTVYADRAAALAAVKDAGSIATYSKAGEMLKDAAAKTFAIVAYMPETVGNEANPKTGTTPPSIDFGVSVVATQLSSEEDAFDDQYDITAPWLGGESVVTPDEDGVYNVTCGEELAWVAKQINNGNTEVKSIKLVKDIDLNNIEWIQIDGAGKNIIFDGNGKKIVNLKVSTGHDAGFFATGSGCNIKNLKFDKANVSGIGRIAVVCGHGMCVDVDNCQVSNSSVTAVVTNNDDGDKAGAIVGYLSGEPVAKVTNCTVEGCTITGYRDVGSVVGYAGGTYTVTGNTAKDCVLVNDRTNNYKNYTTDAEYDVKEIVGEQGASGTYENNTATNITKKNLQPIPSGDTPEATRNNVINALKNANAGDALVLPTNGGNVDISNTTIANGTMIVGNDNTTLMVSQKGNQPTVTANNVVFKGVTFEYGIKDYSSIKGTVKFENCSFNGLVSCYDKTEFINCTFNSTGDNYSVHAYAGESKFVGCHFYGELKNVFVYSDNYNVKADFENCDFHMSTSTPDKSAIMLNASNGNDGTYEVTIKNCTTEGNMKYEPADNIAGNTNYQGIYGLKHKNGYGNPQLVKGILTLDGVVVYQNPAN